MNNGFSKKAAIATGLFCSLFFLVGLDLMIFMAAIPMARLARSASWIECEAMINPVSVRLESHSAEGDTVYQTQASYTYTTPDGWTRSSDRVAFSGGSDNIGSWQQRIYQKLKEMSLRKTVCHVNPDNLDDAVLLREVHEAAIISTSLFGSVFAYIGALMMIYALRWGVRPVALPAPCDIVIAAIPACLNLWSLFVFVTRVPDASARVWLLLVPAAVPAFIGWHWCRMRSIFGAVTFLPSGNIRVGGRLSCDIGLTSDNPDARFEVAVECRQSRTSGSGKRRSTSTTSLWKSPGIIPQSIMPGDGATSLRVALDIPDGLPETSTIGDTTVEWILTLRATDRKIFNRVVFRLDVQRALSETVATKEKEADPSTEDRLFEENGIRMERTPSGGLEIVFPGEAADNKQRLLAEKVAAFGSLFGPFAFATFGCFMLRNFFFHTKGSAGGVPIFFTLFAVVFFTVPILIGLFSSLSALRNIRKKYSSRVFTIEWKHGATLHTALGDRRKKIAELSDILNLTISNVNGRGEKTQHLYIHPRNADAILLTEHLRTPESAGAAGELLTRCIYRSSGSR